MLGVGPAVLSAMASQNVCPSDWAQFLGIWSKFKFSGSTVYYEKFVRDIT